MTFETRHIYDNREWLQPELWGEDGAVGVKPPENTVGIRGPMEGHAEAAMLVERLVLPAGAQQRLQ